MQRVAVVGSGGAGKSVFARELGRLTGLPVHHLDRFMWRPDWVLTPDNVGDAGLLELAGRDRWIIDGNFGRTMPQRFAAADTIVLLDLPRVVCTWRVIRRTIDGISTRESRPDLPEGCEERPDWDFLKWVWNFPTRSRPAVLQRVAEHGRHAAFHHLRSRVDVTRFFETLPTGRPA